MQRLQELGGLVRQRDSDGNGSNVKGGGFGTLAETYDQVSELGYGRYSRVFQVTHRKTGARRAVKTAEKLGPKTEIAGLGLECPARLAKHEADILRHLDHPNVIRLYEVIKEQQRVHLVLELCEGGDVLERILVTENRWPEADIACIFVQMLFAVWHLHIRKVVHRDLKPEHFLFARREPDREPLPPKFAGMKLIDFGLSHRQGLRYTPAGGTLQFMSPEEHAGRTPPDKKDRGDMWSLGVLLHLMLVGHYPSPKLTDANQAQYFAQNSWKDFSKECRELLGLLLRQRPGHRPTAAQALQHPWAAAAAQATVQLPELLVNRFSPAVHAYASAPVLRRIALLAVAREVQDTDASSLRRLMQILTLRCEGDITRAALESLGRSEGSSALSTVANSLANYFEAVDGKRSGAIFWTELLAAGLGSGDGFGFVKTAAADSDAGALPTIRDNACWRAFDLLSTGTGEVSAAALARVIAGAVPSGEVGLTPRSSRSCDHDGSGGAESAAAVAAEVQTLPTLVEEVFPSGTVSSSEFRRLVRGEMQASGQDHGQAKRCCGVLGLLTCFSASRSRSKNQTSSAAPPQGKAEPSYVYV